MIGGIVRLSKVMQLNPRGSAAARASGMVRVFTFTGPHFGRGRKRQPLVGEAHAIGTPNHIDQKWQSLARSIASAARSTSSRLGRVTSSRVGKRRGTASCSRAEIQTFRPWQDAVRCRTTRLRPRQDRILALRPKMPPRPKISAHQREVTGAKATASLFFRRGIILLSQTPAGAKT